MTLEVAINNKYEDHIAHSQKFITYESFRKFAKTPSEGMGPTRKFVDTLLQTS